MERTSLDTALDSRLIVLETRIASLRQTMETAAGTAAVEDAGAISHLEARHKILAEQLHERDLAGPTFRQKIEVEITLLVDDLTSAVDAIIARGQANSTPDQRSKQLL